MQQRIQVSTRFAAEGFGGSRFSPMRSIGAPISAGLPDLTVRPGTLRTGPVSLPMAADSGGDEPAPSPSPSPDVVVRPTTFIVPPAQIRTEPVYVTEAPTSDDNKTLITVAAALGIFTLGAILF